MSLTLCASSLPFRRPPPQPNYPFFKFRCIEMQPSFGEIRRMVFSLSSAASLTRSLPNSHLCCTSNHRKRRKIIVKVYRVFSSDFSMSASSRTSLFRRDNSRDSKGIVTLFMHVGTYTTRNFATLWPSRLQPPLVIGYFRCLHISIYIITLGKRQSICFILQFSIDLCFW